MQLRLGRNATWAVGEVVISGLVLFLLYRIVVATLGVEALGVWSLVMATTSLARFVDLGAAAGLARFVAISEGRGKASEAMAYVQTAILSNLAIYTLMSFALFWPASYGLTFAISGHSLAAALELLPFSLTSFTLMNVSSIIGSALVGQQRADQKSMITAASLAVQVAIAVPLIGTYGLTGLACAQIAQNLFIITVGWVLFLRNLSGRWHLRIPLRWNISAFRVLFGFGVRLQAANISSFLFEPLTKFVMSSLGGLDALGFYEMAGRLVLQVRQLIVMPAQVLTPAFAVNEGNREAQRSLYEKAIAVTLIICLPLMTVLAAASPLISYFWFGHAEMLFIFFVVVSSAGWTVNTIAVPAYLLGIGIGRVGWNIVGSAVISFGSPLIGVVLGWSFGARGVALAAAVMLAAGSLLSMMMNCKEQGIAPLKASSLQDVSTLFRLGSGRARS